MKLAELPTEAIFDQYIPHQIVTVVLTCNWSLLSLVSRPTLFLYCKRQKAGWAWKRGYSHYSDNYSQYTLALGITM